jgi:hypothetical protein
MNKDFVRLFKRFIDDVLNPLAKIYGVKKQRIRLLWDDSCDDLAAFTLHTIIYLNVGYFALKHCDKIPHHEQIIVWYHLLAHEMAVSEVSARPVKYSTLLLAPVLPRSQCRLRVILLKNS